MKKSTPPIIALIGLPGVGKSTVGEILAQRSHGKFRDIDEIIQVKNSWPIFTGCPAPAAETEFRRQEAEILKNLLAFANYYRKKALSAKFIIATGGGIIESPINREILRQQSYVIYLKAPEALIQKRLKLPSSGTGRPRLVTSPARLKARKGLYATTAHLTITVSANDSPLRVVEKIISAKEFREQ